MSGFAVWMVLLLPVVLIVRVFLFVLAVLVFLVVFSIGCFLVIWVVLVVWWFWSFGRFCSFRWI